MEEEPDPENCIKEQPVQLPVHINSFFSEVVTEFRQLFSKQID
jgi:hypothetical protein